MFRFPWINPMQVLYRDRRIPLCCLISGASVSSFCPAWNFQRNNLCLRRRQICRNCVSNKTSWQVFEHRLAEAINRLRETLDELTVQKKGIKPLGLLEGKMKKQIQSKGHAGSKYFIWFQRQYVMDICKLGGGFEDFSNLYLYSGNDSIWRIFFK